MTEPATEPKRCEWCGVVLPVYAHKLKRFCNRECQNRDQWYRQKAGVRLGTPQTCQVCGKEFHKSGRRQYYCGRECAAKHKYAAEKERRDKRKGLVPVIPVMPLGPLSTWDTPATRENQATEQARIEAIVEAAKQAGTLGGVTPGGSFHDRWNSGPVRCKKVG